MQIVTPTGTVDGPTLALRPAQPAIFQNSAGYSAALNQDGSVNSFQNPAQPGSIVTVFASGAGEPVRWSDGQIVPPDQTGAYAAPVSILAGGLSLEVDYAGDAPGLVAGVMQINFRLPAVINTLVPFTFQLEIGTTLGGSNVIAIAKPAP